MYRPTLALLALGLLLGCGQPFVPSDLFGAQSTDTLVDPPRNSDGTPSDPSSPEPDPDEFSPAQLTQLSTWISGTFLPSDLRTGQPLMGSNALLNRAPRFAGRELRDMGGPAHYSRYEVSDHPSLVICGANAQACLGQNESTRIRIAPNYRSYPTLRGPDQINPPCSTCGGSFTVVAAVHRESLGEHVLLSNSQDLAPRGTGPFLGWSKDNWLVFGTQGAGGDNLLRTPLSHSPEGIEIVSAVFSRQDGLRIYWQGELRAFELLKNEGPSLEPTLAPTLGGLLSPVGQSLHIFDYMEFDEALWPQGICSLHQYLNRKYDLKLELSCLKPSPF